MSNYFCPQCGEHTFGGENKYTCSACNFSFYLNSSCAVAVIIKNSSGQVLLGKRSFEPYKGLLDVPGGFVDPGESIEHACIRELKEELDIEIGIVHYLGSFAGSYLRCGSERPVINCVFLCNLDDVAIQKMTPKDDIQTLERYYPKDIISNRLAPCIHGIEQFF